MTRITATLLFLLFLPVAVHGTGENRLCVSEAKDHHKNISYAELLGKPFKPLDYSVQVGDGPIVEVQQNDGFDYPLKNTDSRILIEIRLRGEMVESFWLDYERYESSELCLWFKPLYHTWSVWRLNRSRHLCDCD